LNSIRSESIAMYAGIYTFAYDLLLQFKKTTTTKKNV